MVGLDQAGDDFEVKHDVGERVGEYGEGVGDFGLRGGEVEHGEKREGRERGGKKGGSFLRVFF